MSLRSRSLARLWWLIPLCACGFLGWTDSQRIQRVLFVMNTDYEDAVVDPASPTGYAGGKRWLIVPEHNNRSYQWIAETQQMVARGEWRVRHIDYENAPFGRDVHSASSYRWWLGLLAWSDHTLTGRSPGLAVERVALWADPLLHLLLLVGTTVFVARQFGTLPAALLALGLATLYPLAGGFLPGAPDDHGLAQACALWSVLPLLAGIGRPPGPATPPGKPGAGPIENSRHRPGPWFFLAGIAGGLGLWISAPTELPVLIGIALGGLAAMAFTRRDVKPGATAGENFPWNIWALGGATTSLAAWLAEYFPSHLDLHLEVNHPVFGLAWLGLGGWLILFADWRKRGKAVWRLRWALGLVLATAAVAALPVAMGSSGIKSFLAGDLASSRLTFLPNGVAAENFLTWIHRDGTSAAVCATCLPLAVLVPVFWLLAGSAIGGRSRPAIALALGPVAVGLVFATRQLAWWNTCDAMLLALVVATSAALQTGFEVRFRAWSAFVAAVLLPGFLQLLPPASGAGVEFTRLEVEGLVERALAHWIADHTPPGGAVILVPPDRTPSWCFHGGLRGLGTANWENRAGLAATVRIVTATTADEAQALLNERGVTHLILPSWDTDLDEFSRWSLKNPEDAFVMALHHWALPPWLRPLPYSVPVVPGFGEQSVAIFEVTDESNRATALSRLAEYFVEMQRSDLAADTGRILERYPADLGALVALAQVEKSGGDAAAFDRTFTAIVASVANGFDRPLAWDRRLSLAVVLALGQRNDLAREQLRRCLDKLDATRVRSLTTGSLYRLQVLGKAFDLPIADPALRELARHLLPAELRSRL